MKKNGLWSVFVLIAIVMVLPFVSACGGDDDESPSGGGNSSSSLVDGVHVNSRKLLSLGLYKNNSSTNICRFTMSYDSKGRLERIVGPFTYTSTDGGKTYTEDFPLLSIDYDLKFIEYYNDRSWYNSTTQQYEIKYARVFFTLNNKGFIATLGNCELSYDNDGYLVGAKTVKDMWTFAYSEGDVIKYMVETLKNSNIGIYYTHYEEKNGDVYFTIDNLDKVFYSWDSGLSYTDKRMASLLILYHAGLFGNISKRANLTGTNRNAVIEQISNINQSTQVFRCSFVFDK